MGCMQHPARLQAARSRNREPNLGIINLEQNMAILWRKTDAVSQHPSVADGMHVDHERCPVVRHDTERGVEDEI